MPRDQHLPRYSTSLTGEGDKGGGQGVGDRGLGTGSGGPGVGDRGCGGQGWGTGGVAFLSLLQHNLCCFMTLLVTFLFRL